jgi:beta-glucosidase
VRFIDGAYPSAAAALAKGADAVVVFATQWMVEGEDVPDLSLPNGQDALIEAVAAANPKTIVVLETGGPVLMPWLSAMAKQGRGGRRGVVSRCERRRCPR